MSTPEKRKLLLIKHQKNLKDLVFPEPLEDCCKKWSKAIALPMTNYLNNPNDLLYAARMVDIVKFCPVCGKRIENPFILSRSSLSVSVGSSTATKLRATGVIDDIISRRSYAGSGMSSVMSSDSASEEEDDPLEEIQPLINQRLMPNVSTIRRLLFGDHRERTED